MATYVITPNSNTTSSSSVPANSTPSVQTNNVFVYSGGGITSATNIGSFQVNSIIARDATPRPRVDTTNIPDGPSAVIAGSAEASTRAPTLSNLRAIGTVGGVVNTGNDLIAVGQHVWQGNGAEAVTEGAGVVGQAGGAWAGAEFGFFVGAPAGPYVQGVSTLFFGGVGAFGGSVGAKDLATFLTGGNTPDKLGPPLTLPGNLNIAPTVTNANGDQYALVEVDDKATWFVISSPAAVLAGAAPYTEVVRGQVAAELTGQYLQASGYEPQLGQYQAQVAEIQRSNLQDAFVRSEAEYANSVGPNGQPWGTPATVAPNATQNWSQSPQAGTALNTLEVRNGDGSTTRIVTEVDRGTGSTIKQTTYEIASGAGVGAEPRLVGIIDHQNGTSFSLNRATGQLEQNTAPPEFAPIVPPRAPSATFITPIDSDHVSLVPGGTVSDIVLLQNRAGNPITAADIRTANPELGLNANLTNVPAGASLLVPTRVGDNLVTNLPGGGTQSVNTRTQDITTDVPNANGTRTQTTSSSDGEFTRTVRSITYNADGEITLESRYSLNTLDGTRTEIPLIPAPSPTTGPAISTDSAAPAPADTPLTDEQISIIRGEDATTGGSANTSAPAPILVADAGSHAGGAIVSDAGGGGAPSTTESTTPVPASNPPLPVIESAPSAPEIIVDTAPANDFSLNNFLGGAGSGLTPAQQGALANQLDGMGLGGADDLQFFPLPGGGALIQNADGEIVGEIAPRSDGTLSISGNSINPEDGSSGTISNSIDAGGTVQTTAQYTQAQIAQMSQLQGGLGLVNGLLNLENFDDLSTLGQINSLVGLYSNLQRATGGELLGVLPGGLAAGLGFLGALESGDAGSMRQYYKFNSILRNIYADYMPILISKFTIKQASNDAHWQQAA